MLFLSRSRRNTLFDCDWRSGVWCFDRLGVAVFFFSSRRRHTRFDCDWSSDVCSSDLDPLWADFKHLILPLGYTACWSTPICGLQGGVASTFAFYYRHFDRPGPDPFHQRLVEACTDLCALALEREQARRRIRQLAFYDGLTTLPNRSLLLAQAEQALSVASHEGHQLAVGFIDQIGRASCRERV